jgi:SAM-dependent methyltransferase
MNGPADAVDSATVQATLSDSLEGLDDALNYRDWIVDLARPYLGPSVLEVGAGHGTFTDVFADLGSVHAVEPGERPAALLAEHFRDRSSVTTQRGVVSDVSARDFDAAVMINVLEHIEDDGQALTDIRERLGPDGRLVVWVPAFPLLFSRFDLRLGHHRRYRRQELETLVTERGYVVVESHHVNLPGWFSWLLVVRLLRIEPTNPAAIRFFDRWLVPATRRLERLVRPPFGQSIFLAARRTG